MKKVIFMNKNCVSINLIFNKKIIYSEYKTRNNGRKLNKYRESTNREGYVGTKV